MSWKFDQNNPIYLQIITHLEYRILSGQYKPGDKLESVRELASIAGVNPNTMQKALQEMEGMGLIITQRTSGRFITDDAATIQKLREEVAQDRSHSFVKELQKLGYAKDEILCFVQDQLKKKSKAISNLEELMKEEKNER
ncbi:MAG: GntR family transcriptional regulator [Peptostreptococcaceae bacterium]|nr:GntR family transcriptional regulator [Peptostreptococcaceae bacterium]